MFSSVLSRVFIYSHLVLSRVLSRSRVFCHVLGVPEDSLMCFSVFSIEVLSMSLLWFSGVLLLFVNDFYVIRCEK
jgi:hypothetical protein